ncbi:MAG: YbaK/EbsC family protein [Candidatus Nanopelagicales bacterium]
MLGVSRLSLPDAPAALAATGYERGTTTPFGMTTPWPVIADERIRGRDASLGADAHGVAAIADADEVVKVLRAAVADQR